MSGVVATSIDVLMLIFLVEVADVHVTLAAFFAAMAGGITNFLVNKFWAFGDASPIDIRQVTLYTMVSLVTAGFVAASLHVLAIFMGLPYLIAKAIAAVLVFLAWGYPAQSRLVFPASQRKAAEALAAD